MISANKTEILSYNLNKLIENESINKFSIDVKITDNLETIPWWNIISRIWNRSHLNIINVAATLLKAVQNPKFINKLNLEQLGKLDCKIKWITCKFLTTKKSKNLLRETLQDVETVVLNKINDLNNLKFKET